MSTPTPATAGRPTQPPHRALRLNVFSCMSSPHVQLASAAFNDHYSPVKAVDYIEQRLRPAIAYYQRRVPINTYFGMAMKLLLLTAAVASSVLATREVQVQPAGDHRHRFRQHDHCVLRVCRRRTQSGTVMLAPRPH